jgi:hygromycin-B 7''-O-kinase
MADFAQARARRALQGAKLDMMMPLTRASSVTNEVWLGEGCVIRVNRRLDQRLRREAQLAPQLPSEVGYPEVIAYGGELGNDWFVCGRVPGLVLARCWPAMTRSERREVIVQFAAQLRELHRFEFPDGLPQTVSPQLLGGPDSLGPTTPLLEAIERARSLEHVDGKLLTAAAAIVRETSYVLDPWQSRTTVHGDLHFENVLWDGSHITALLDFEYARAAPPDVDLDVFLRFCAYPFLHVAPDYERLTRAEDYAEVPFWLAEEYPELFGHTKQFERLRLYSIAYDVRELLAFPPTRSPKELSEHHPHNRLRKAVEGRSHLDQMSARSRRQAG